MEKLHWFKFYPSDWRADKGLRLCGAAARGLWIEMLCLMHESKPYGHLLVNGRPVTETQMSSLSGIPLDQVLIHLEELENADVFSRNGNGVIYSRRMTRDARKAAKCSHAGKEGGGNPSFQTEKTTTFKGESKGDDKGEHIVTFALEDRGHIPDLPKRDSLEKVVLSSFQGPNNQKPWTAEQKKAAWQGKICAEAQRTMTEDTYADFLVAWANNEASAVSAAERIDKRLRESDARRSA